MARWVAFVAVAVVGLIGSDRVRAHGQFEQFPIGAKRLKVDTRKAPARHKLLFSSTHEPAISPDHDPALD